MAEGQAARGPQKPWNDAEMLHSREAAILAGITERTLAAMRKRGDGPPYVKYSHNVLRYSRTELLAWLNARMIRGGRCGHPVITDTICTVCGRRVDN